MRKGNQGRDCLSSGVACICVGQSRLLSFVVVGGGPTSVEFASELHDFLRDDVHKWVRTPTPHFHSLHAESEGLAWPLFIRPF